MSVTENQAVIDLAARAGQPVELSLGSYWVVQAPDRIEQIDLTGDEYRAQPRRIVDSVHLTHADSLLAYWDKHFDGSSEVYADRDKRSVTAVLDAHHAASGPADERPRWQLHRAVLLLAYSDPLKAWLGSNGQLDTQVGFAEFLEEQMTYIAEPAAADLVEMVQHFQATVGATFKSGYRLRDGQRQLEYTETIDATVKGDSIAVPQTITLRLPIWRGASTAEEMTARLRYRVNHNGAGKLGIGYKLDRPTEVIDAAFDAEVDLIEQHVGRPVLRGVAAG